MTTECKASSSEEPGAVIPHAGMCAGGRPSTGVSYRYTLLPSEIATGKAHAKARRVFNRRFAQISADLNGVTQTRITGLTGFFWMAARGRMKLRISRISRIGMQCLRLVEPIHALSPHLRPLCPMRPIRPINCRKLKIKRVE